MENTTLPVYVLITSRIDGNGIVRDTISGVTFNLHEADSHKAQGIEHDYQTHEVVANYREDAEQSAVVQAMRTFRGIVEEMQREALR